MKAGWLFARRCRRSNWLSFLSLPIVQNCAELGDQIKDNAHVDGVIDVEAVRVRWLGHRLQAELHIIVDEELPTRESHRIAEEVRHHLFHVVPGLAVITVHVDPGRHDSAAHELTAHHEPGHS